MKQNIKIWKKQQIFPSFWQKKLGDTISLCMIMRNEEKHLARCLKSVKGLVDEIIICDTGSTDKSIQIARAHGARVFQDPWQDDFARPRNIAIA
ncbi:MAG: glycosyltransferase, partial [Candidatus Omnitrophica bacterium]|nr:glycosyltransferase [Candidatus Omnitrophota bacterium]